MVKKRLNSRYLYSFNRYISTTYININMPNLIVFNNLKFSCFKQYIIQHFYDHRENLIHSLEH